MKRIDIILKEMRHYSKQRPVDTQTLASKLGFSRANVSHDLNELVKQNVIHKTSNRPVLFYPVKTSHKMTQLEQFKLTNPSLNDCIDKAIAAVLYPPKRMPILLTGETGVGKSMFSQLIYDFSVEQGIIASEANLTVFNCADYAENPQLILSHIFGVTKGAYTNALSDKPGLIESTNHGILFLDEIHRLPPEGQEMLFTFMDNGTFRRLGESAKERQADVQIICATTEKIDSHLLDTFLRRIPMKIQLPNLKERGFKEKLTLIYFFLNQEAEKLKEPLHITNNSIRALLGYPCQHNIGQLKSDIQLLAARAYATKTVSHKDQLAITSYDLPTYIKNGLYDSEDKQQIWEFMPGTNTRFITFTPGIPNNYDVVFQEQSIYEVVQQKLSDIEKLGIDSETANHVIYSTVDHYVAQIKSQSQQLKGPPVREEMLQTTLKVIELASQMLNYHYPETLYSILGQHLYTTVNKIKSGDKLLNPALSTIKQEHKQVYKVALSIKPLIENSFQVILPEEEVGFLTLFLLPEQKSPLTSHPVQILIVTHGNSTASSMASFVNDLLGYQNVIGFDMPLSVNASDVLENIKDYLTKEQNQGDWLLMVDMGSLTNFSQELMTILQGNMEIFSLVSTLHVLEASQKASLGYSLTEIIYSLRNITQPAVNSDQPLPAIAETVTKLYIIAYCTTGEGSAKLIKELLKDKLNLYNGQCEIIFLQLTDQLELMTNIQQIQEKGKIIFCAGAFTIPELDIPYLSLNQLLNDHSLTQIQQVIDYEYSLQNLITYYGPMIEHLPGGDLISTLDTWLKTLRTDIDIDISPEIQIGLISHLASTIDHHAQQKDQRPSDKERFDAIDFRLADHIRMIEQIYHMTFSEKDVRNITKYLYKQSFL
ncbi:sigma 54-interacting transcriptional regulator [Vagococcus sp. BWB3-3]|uniref:DNA translocase FtsK n=1 Tax=Vagococcus allomyrinae TaxID=2794353 RepID=A0A940PGJ4_9ENTE|nr:sigma 54-interacting transcriptional regulator [Vagococcus allomyrinae]MBP1044470.1 sigma 54-interacting transcriptional regulator [Vagococcus allomyrinae]